MKTSGGTGPVGYRRRAILNRIHSALDAFYLLQKIDWEYNVRHTLDKILALALEEVEFEGGKRIERAAQGEGQTGIYRSAAGLPRALPFSGVRGRTYRVQRNPETVRHAIRHR